MANKLHSSLNYKLKPHSIRILFYSNVLNLYLTPDMSVPLLSTFHTRHWSESRKSKKVTKA